MESSGDLDEVPQGARNNLTAAVAGVDPQHLPTFQPCPSGWPACWESCPVVEAPSFGRFAIAGPRYVIRPQRRFVVRVIERAILQTKIEMSIIHDR